MTPEQRKETSELILHKRGIRINVQLHVIESDDEVSLRTPDEVLQRLLALWAVSAAAVAQDVTRYHDYLQAQGLLGCLSAQEHAFLAGEDQRDDAYRRFSERQECLCFLAWAAGLSDKLALPIQASNPKPVLKYFPQVDFPQGHEAPERLQRALTLRSKAQVLDWSDLLYRAHWAVRHAQMTGRAAPGNLYATAVREWHQAVNWLCRYEEEDDWDKVSTET